MEIEIKAQLKELRIGFACAAGDPEIVELAEWGMDDYAGVVGKYND